MSSGPQLVVQMSSDEAKLYQGMQKLIDQQKRLQEGLQNTGKAGKKAEADLSSISRAIEGAGLAIASLRGGVGTLQSVFGLVNTQIEMYERKLDMAVAVTDRLAQSQTKLVQVSGGELTKLLGQRNAASIRTGMTPEQAGDAIFALQGAGENKPGVVDYLGQVRGVVAPEAAANVVNRLKGNLGGALTPQQLLNATSIAAESSPVSIEQFAGALPMASPSLMAKGASPGQALALVSELTKSLGDPNRASAELKGLFSKLIEDPDFAGLDPVQSVRKLSGMTVDQREGYLGDNAEAKEALRELSSKLPSIEAQAKRIDAGIAATGTDDDYLLTKARERRNTETIEGRTAIASDLAARAKNAKDLAIERATGREAKLIQMSEEAVDASLADASLTMQRADYWVGKTARRAMHLPDRMQAAASVVAGQEFAAGRIDLAERNRISGNPNLPMDQAIAFLESTLERMAAAAEALERSALSQEQAAAANNSRLQRQAGQPVEK